MRKLVAVIAWIVVLAVGGVMSVFVRLTSLPVAAIESGTTTPSPQACGGLGAQAFLIVPLQAGTATPTAGPGTATPTAAPGTATPTAGPGTATPTSVPATATPTSVPATATPTSVPATATPTAAPATATPTVSPIATPTATAPPTGTATPTPAPTSTASPTPTATPTPTPEQEINALLPCVAGDPDLVAHLDNALEDLQKGDVVSACQQLAVFIQDVNRQLVDPGRSFLISAAQTIQVSLGCPPTQP